MSDNNPDRYRQMHDLKGRRGQRSKAVGEISLLFSDSAHLQVKGKLMDQSSDGFRVAHNYCNFECGQEVCYHHGLTRGRAKVVWNRIFGERVETGFLIVPE